jgi:hypothetical protein
MITKEPFTVAMVVGEDEPRPLQHAAQVGRGPFCPAVHDDLQHVWRWTPGVDGVNCPRCAGRLRPEAAA